VKSAQKRVHAQTREFNTSQVKYVHSVGSPPEVGHPLGRTGRP
jgi:hypothetical protein